MSWVFLPSRRIYSFSIASSKYEWSDHRMQRQSRDTRHGIERCECNQDGPEEWKGNDEACNPKLSLCSHLLLTQWGAVWKEEKERKKKRLKEGWGCVSGNYILQIHVYIERFQEKGTFCTSIRRTSCHVWGFSDIAVLSVCFALLCSALLSYSFSIFHIRLSHFFWKIFRFHTCVRWKSMPLTGPSCSSNLSRHVPIR